MACPECDADRIRFSVPEDYREYTPEEAAIATFCPRCLTLEPVDDGTPADENSEFSRVSDAFPTGSDRAIPLAIALGLSTSLATNRDAIGSLLRETERSGTDPLLVIDRLVADPAVEPAMDLERRAHQLEQLLY